jgi:CTP:molybdopterin cytidylyltransferase MocA
MQTPAVILAAGASRRLGQPKQLIAIDGELLLHRMARIALQVCAPVLVVLGHEAEQMKAALGELPVQCIKNLDWEEGMASSLRAAVSALPPEAIAAIFLVCDQPAVDQALLERILAGESPAAMPESGAFQRCCPATISTPCCNSAGTAAPRDSLRMDWSSLSREGNRIWTCRKIWSACAGHETSAALVSSESGRRMP